MTDDSNLLDTFTQSMQIHWEKSQRKKFAYEKKIKTEKKNILN